MFNEKIMFTCAIWVIIGLFMGFNIFFGIMAAIFTFWWVFIEYYGYFGYVYPYDMPRPEKFPIRKNNPYLPDDEIQEIIDTGYGMIVRKRIKYWAKESGIPWYKTINEANVSFWIIVIGIIFSMLMAAIYSG